MSDIAKGVLWVECSKLSFLSGWGLAAKGGLLPPGLVVHLRRVGESRGLLSKVLSFVHPQACLAHGRVSSRWELC